MDQYEVEEELRPFFEPVDDSRLDVELPELLDDMTTAVAITGLPVVGPEKFEKLVEKLKSTVKMERCNVVDIFIPQEGGKGKGVVFVDCETREDAARLERSCYTFSKETGAKTPKSFGSKNKLYPIRIPDLSALKDVPEEFVPPPIGEYQPAPTLKDWLYDEQLRDQYIVRWAKDDEHHTELAYGDPQGNSTMVNDGAGTFRTVQWKVEWSPSGSYLVTFHVRGIQVWAGEDCSKVVARIPHKFCDRVDFSPDEKWIITYDSNMPSERERDCNKAQVWNFEQLLRDQHSLLAENARRKEQGQPPLQPTDKPVRKFQPLPLIGTCPPRAERPRTAPRDSPSPRQCCSPCLTLLHGDCQIRGKELQASLSGAASAFPRPRRPEICADRPLLLPAAAAPGPAPPARQDANRRAAPLRPLPFPSRLRAPDAPQARARRRSASRCSSGRRRASTWRTSSSTSWRRRRASGRWST